MTEEPRCRTSDGPTTLTLPLPAGTELHDPDGADVPGATVDTTGVTFTPPAGTHGHLLACR